MADDWIDAAALSDVPEGDAIAVQLGGKETALYEVDCEVFATDNICTHGHAGLSDGFLEGRENEYPLHQGRFDVCSGQALCAPLTENIKTYTLHGSHRQHARLLKLC
jgi:naphthalene 1,2-dioxygenase system ferredoxin subunit